MAKLPSGDCPLMICALLIVKQVFLPLAGQAAGHLSLAHQRHTINLEFPGYITTTFQMHLMDPIALKASRYLLPAFFLYHPASPRIRSNRSLNFYSHFLHAPLHINIQLIYTPRSVTHHGLSKDTQITVIDNHMSLRVNQTHSIRMFINSGQANKYSQQHP